MWVCRRNPIGKGCCRRQKYSQDEQIIDQITVKPKPGPDAGTIDLSTPLHGKDVESSGTMAYVAEALGVFILPDFWGLVISGVMSAVGAAQMSYQMPSFPSFLNYWVALISVPMYAAIGKLYGEPLFETLSAEWRSANPGKALEHHKQYLILGLANGVNWIGVQYVAAWVDGNLQQVVNGLNAVFVLFLSIPLTNLKVTNQELFGSFVVIFGVMIASWPAIQGLFGFGSPDNEEHPPWYDSWYFTLIYLVSVPARSLVYVWSDKVFQEHDGLYPATCCCWCQLYGIPMCILAIPIEMLPQVTGTPTGNTVSYVLENQLAAFRCFFGVPLETELRQGEEPIFRCATKLASIWVLVFTVGFVGMFYFMTAFTKKTSAFWTQILSAIILPVSAFTFSVKAIVGDIGYAPFTIFSGVGFVVIFAGVVLRGVGEDQREKNLNESF